MKALAKLNESIEEYGSRMDVRQQRKDGDLFQPIFPLNVDQGGLIT